MRYFRDLDNLVLSEEDILEEYWEYWQGQMLKAVTRKNTGAYGKPELITKEHCIKDWISVNWATEVTK